MRRLEVHTLDEARVLIASHPWSESDLENRWVHISNASVNRNAPDYDASDQNRTLEDAFGDTLASTMRERMNKQVGDIMQSVYSKAKKSQFMPLLNCYELFGLDFVVDTTSRPWLLEVNPEPSIALFPGRTRGALLGDDPWQTLPTGWHKVWSSAMFDAMKRMRRR